MAFFQVRKHFLIVRNHHFIGRADASKIKVANLVLACKLNISRMGYGVLPACKQKAGNPFGYIHFSQSFGFPSV